MSGDTDKYDFFVSYAREDNKAGWITDFVAALLAEHERFAGGRKLAHFFDEKDIRRLDDWRQSLEDGIAHSRLFLAFLSPRYFASESCRREWQSWIETENTKHILSQGAAPIYMIEVPGFLAGVSGLDVQECRTLDAVARRIAELCKHADVDGLIAQASPVIHQIRDRRQITKAFVQPFDSDAITDLSRDDLREELAKLAQDIGERSLAVQRAAESQSTVPSYNKFFAGRVDELLALRKSLKDDQAGVICGIHGLGGIGKTELAFAYAHAFAGVYPGGRFYLPCDGKRTIQETMPALTDGSHAFADFRNSITDEDRKTPDNHAGAVRALLTKRLESHGHVLLVLDNVTDLELLAADQLGWLTAIGPKLHLLTTTRQLPPKASNWLTLGELSEADSLRLLERHRPFASDDERAAAKTIVQLLGGFAIAIELVGAWLVAKTSATYRSALAEFNLNALATLKYIGADPDVELVRHRHEQRLGAVLGPVLDGLSPAERRTMEYAAWMAPDAVALPWLRELVGADFPEILEPKGGLDPWIELTTRLVRLALLTRSGKKATTDARIVRVHRLVQELVKQRIEKGQEAARAKAVLALVQGRAAAVLTPVGWEPLLWELEPMEVLATYWADSGHERASWLLNQVGQRFDALARWSEAEQLYRRALAINEAFYGRDHYNVTPHLNNLALLLQATNRLAEAERLMRRALAISEAFYGEGHPNVAPDLNNLATLLMETNRLAEAEALYGRALDINEASYGQDHPELAISLNNLAVLLMKTNRLAEAEPLMRRALDINEASHGKYHPKVAIRLNNLALLLVDTSRLAEAELLYCRALAIDEASYGTDHPDVATGLHNFALLLLATNRLAEAEPRMRRAVEILVTFWKSTGHEHPKLQKVVGGYQVILKEMGWSRKQIRATLRKMGLKVRSPSDFI